jgi:hypothetical protein
MLREGHRLGLLDNRVLRKTFEHKGAKWHEAGEDFIRRNFVTCTLHKILLGRSGQGVLNEWGM